MGYLERGKGQSNSPVAVGWMFDLKIVTASPAA